MGYGILIAMLAAGDLGLKWLIERRKPDEFPKPLNHTKGKILLYRNHNSGFPFGFMERHGELVRGLPLAVTSGLVGALLVLMQQKGKRWQKLGLSLVIGGSFSNLYDRFFRRYVVDYFSFQFGFLKKVVFNLGDLFVFIGSGLLFGIQLAAELFSWIQRGKGENL